MAIDRIDWHYDSAAEAFCRETGKSKPEAGDEITICRRAGNHIGLFIMWLVKNDLLDAEEGDPEAAEMVRNEEMLGVDYLIDCIDGKLWDSDIKVFVADAIEDIYNDYLNVYAEWYKPADYSTVSSWADYRSLAALLDAKFGGKIAKLKRKA